MTGTIGQLLDDAVRRLRAAGIDEPQLDARLLVQAATGLDHAQLIAGRDEAAGSEISARLAGMLDRRAAAEPVSRILGRREFYGLAFEITPDVLDPRPETELLVEHAVRDYGDHPGPVFCDLCTGSGAVGIAILRQLQEAVCVGADISDAALEVARRNCERNGVSSRMKLVRSDYLAQVDRKFDFIVANPPYIRTDIIGKLAREVRMHDPAIALDGGADGLEAYRKILVSAHDRLERDGRLYLELGFDQAESFGAMAAECGWRLVGLASDLGGGARMAVLESALREGTDEAEKPSRRKDLEFGKEKARFTALQG